MSTSAVCPTFQFHPWVSFCRSCGQDESAHNFKSRENLDETDHPDREIRMFAKSDPAAWIKDKDKTLTDSMNTLKQQVDRAVKTVERSHANIHGAMAILGEDGADSIDSGAFVIAAARNKATSSCLRVYLSQLSAERGVKAAQICVAESVRVQSANAILNLEAVLVEEGKGSLLTAGRVNDKVGDVLGL